MRIGIGCDHNAVELKNEIKTFIKSLGHDVTEYGELGASCGEVDYPGVAFEVGEAVQTGEVERGILLCGTGLGMAIAAGKVPGIRAVTCHDTYSAERAQKVITHKLLLLALK